MITAIAVSRPPTRCAYCHASIQDTYAGCARCGTACHTDCMELAGGCPTLGCGPRRVRAGRPSLLRRVNGALETGITAVQKTVTLLFKALFWVGLIGAGVYIATPNLMVCRANGDETAAIGALRTVGAAQSLFRESDKDGNKKLDYAANLEALGNAGTTGLIDSVLASGKKQGYRFELRRSDAYPEFCWIAYAWPLKGRGDRVFIRNHEGKTYSRRLDKNRRFEMVMIDTSTCAIPAGFTTQVGRF